MALFAGGPCRLGSAGKADHLCPGILGDLSALDPAPASAKQSVTIPRQLRIWIIPQAYLSNCNLKTTSSYRHTTRTVGHRNRKAEHKAFLLDTDELELQQNTVHGSASNLPARKSLLTEIKSPPA